MSANETVNSGSSTHWSVYLGIGVGGVALVLASIGFVWVSRKNRQTVEPLEEMVIPTVKYDDSSKTNSMASEDTASIAPFELQEFEFINSPILAPARKASLTQTSVFPQDMAVSFQQPATQMKDLPEVPKAQPLFR